MTRQNSPESAIAICRQSIETHSKSFALASRLLPAKSRDDAAILYAWCRQTDDAIDESPPYEQAIELDKLRRDLDSVYAGAPQTEPVLTAFQDLVQRCEIPRQYPFEMLEGMSMDASGQAYPDMRTLLQYCYRVASTVGLMMSHVIGLSRDAAMNQAAHLGIAMQLTNIGRDVLEDWERGRLYLPDDLLTRNGAGDLRSRLGSPFPVELATPVAHAVEELLQIANLYYRSSDRGMPALPWRAAFGVRTARLVYAEIGHELGRAHFDVCAGRAFVSTPRKAMLVTRAGIAGLWELPGRWMRFLARGLHHSPPKTRIEFSNVLLCQ